MDEDGYGYYDTAYIHSIFNLIDSSFILQKVVGMDGSVAALELPYDEANVMQKDLGKPDHEDFSGPTGNEGVTTTHFYNRTVSEDQKGEYYVTESSRS